MYLCELHGCSMTSKHFSYYYYTGTKQRSVLARNAFRDSRKCTATRSDRRRETDRGNTPVRPDYDDDDRDDDDDDDDGDGDDDDVPPDIRTSVRPRGQKRRARSVHTRTITLLHVCVFVIRTCIM